MSEIVPYKPPAPPIAKGLLKKEELTLRERLWVWNEIVFASIGAVTLTIGISWLALPLTMAWVGTLLTIVGTVIFALSAFYFAERCFGDTAATSSVQRKRPLNHHQRAELCLLDRNRRARPHRGDYLYAENRYSVWVTYTDLDGRGKQLTLMMLRHVRPLPYFFTYPLPRRLRFSQRAWWVSIPNGQDAIQKMGHKPDLAKVQEVFESMEAAANALEEIPHLAKVEEFRGEEIALELRRTPPSAKTEAIAKARKMLN